jgi:uncharacterized protein
VKEPRLRSGGRGHAQLHFPLERLKRREPERHWRVSVEVADLRDPEAPAHLDAPEDAAGDPAALHVNDTVVRSDRVVDIDVELTTVAEGVIVEGKVSTEWQAPCSRCLRSVSGPIESQVQELFEVRPVEGVSYLLGDETLDLTGMVRDALLLDLPLLAGCPEPQPCPHAPAELVELTEDEIDDEPEGPMADPRWAALDGLKFED